MQTYQGKSAFGGVAIGKIRIWKKNVHKVKRVRVDSVSEEKHRFYQACEKAKEELQGLYRSACNEVGEANAAIFEIHQMMLMDDDYLEAVEGLITGQEINAEYAVAVTGERFATMFASMQDSYMQARAEDVKDISERVLRILNGEEEMQTVEQDPVILVAEDLAPSETVQLDKSKILAFVTRKGSVNSHTAILARTMNIPAIVGAKIPLDEIEEGVFGAVDGDGGILYYDPDKETLAKMEEKQNKEQEQKLLLETLKKKENCTIDGRCIQLYANIGNPEDLALVLQNDAGGIGLFRSEFLYLERNDFPGEEEQFSVYKSVLESMAGKKVIIRTLDLGADKQADYIGLATEENPALGVRGIRYCLKNPKVFRTQLRALFRAGVYGNLSIMYPMIISCAELKQIQEHVAVITEELTREGIPFVVPEQGIMIETPAGVMLAEELAQEVSFFSIGTNDLSQYTLAIDRQNAALDGMYDPRSEAILRMIERTIACGHKAGIWVGICGELGADTTLTETFLKMGVDELSVAPGRVLSVRKAIRETNCGTGGMRKDG